MLRQNNAQEILEKLEKVYKYTVPTVDPVSTALASAADAGDAALDLTSATGFADGDDVFIAGDELELATLADVDADPDATLTRKLAFAAALGAAVTKVTRDDLGYVEEGGVTLTGSFSQTPIGAANARSAIAYIAAEGGELSASFGLREANLKNILASFGIPESSLSGAGTLTDPYLANVGRDTIGSQTNHAYRATLKLLNNKNVHVDFLNCAPEVAINAALGAKGQPVVWTIQFRPTSILFRSW